MLRIRLIHAPAGTADGSAPRTAGLTWMGVRHKDRFMAPMADRRPGRKFDRRLVFLRVLGLQWIVISAKKSGPFGGAAGLAGKR